jgi:PAS domain S-box-containing protein
MTPSLSREEFFPTLSRLSRYAWLPIPILLAAIIAFRVAGLHEIYDAPDLALILRLIFYTSVSLVTLFFIGRSFLVLGTLKLLFLECGLVFWSLTGPVANIASRGDVNIEITIFNLSIFLASLCHMAGAIFSLRPHRVLSARPLWLVAGCTIALGTLSLISYAALEGWLPVFFISGHGGTPVRQLVLLSSITAFVVSACLLGAGHQEKISPFLSWYRLALLLFAVGLFGVMAQLYMSSIINWLGRTAQWLGGIYLLLASIAALRDSRLQIFPTPEKTDKAYYSYMVAILLVMSATALRLAFLQILGNQAAFLMFFPAVTLAALYGGLRAGLLATFFSAFLANYFWMQPTDQLALSNGTNVLLLMIFCMNGAFISFVVEAMHRAQIQAIQAKAEAKHAVEQKIAAEALENSRSKLQAAFASMQEAIFIADIEGQLTDFNDEFVTYHRFANRDECSKRMEDCPRYLEAFFQDGTPAPFEMWALPRALRGETGSNIQYMLRRKDTGEKWWGSYNFGPTRNSDGKITGAVIAVREITELKQAEELLRDSEERLQQALHISRSFAFEWNPATDEILRSESCAKILGLVDKEIIHDTGQLFLQRIHPEDREQFKQTLNNLTPASPTYSTEYRLLHGDGRIVVLQESAQATFNDLGTVQRLVGVTTDITERKEAEEKLRKSEARLIATLRSTVDEIWIVDPQGDIVSISDSARVNLGLSADNRLTIENLLDQLEIFRPDGTARPKEEAILPRALRGEFIKNDQEIIRNLATGHLQWREVSSAPIRDVEDRIIGAVAIARDITERRHAEEKIKASLAEKEVLLKEIHHRVKNNLQVISSLVSLQVANLTDNKIRDELNDVSDRVRSMALVHEKLYQTGNIAQLDFADYATTMLHTLWRSYGALANKIRLNLSLAPVTLPIEIAVPCGLILNEMAVNALKHAFPNNRGGEVMVGLDRNSDSNTVSLWMRDNGIGLPPGLDWRQSRSLGLRLVDILTKQLRGVVETGPGPGTEFRVTFSLTQLNK